MNIEERTNQEDQRSKRARRSSADARPGNNDHLTVVGIGSSAGGLAALEDFFKPLPPDTGMTFVVVTHMDPQKESLLPGLLQKWTSMPVHQVTKKVAIQADHVYVMAPNQRILFKDTHLATQDFDQPVGLRTPIDFFFRSLAAFQDSAIAVILSGAGADGAVGVKAVKERGGLLLVQDPAEATYDSMPRAAIESGLADVVLPAGGLAKKLVAYRRNRVQIIQDIEALTSEELNTIEGILKEVQRRTGHDFSQYKLITIVRRMQQRMQLMNQKTFEDYSAFLRDTPSEADALFNDLLIGVTNFFRDPRAWQALAEQVIPLVFQGKKAGDTVRVWSVGCATGEEAYSLGILLLEHRASLHLPASRQVRIQIFATDLDEDALNKAREGLYPESIEADVSDERLERFFTKENVHYRVRNELRELVLFSNHSVLRDPPFSRLDLITARNVLIYLNRDLQQNVFKIFHYALNEKGYLFLGNSETIDPLQNLFHAIDKKHSLFQGSELHGQRRHLPALPLTLNPRSPQPGGRRPSIQPAVMKAKTRTLFDSAGNQHGKMLESYAPPSILVDETFRIVHLSETAGRYIQMPAGPVSHDLLKLVHPELQLEVRAAVLQALEQNKKVVTSPIDVQFTDSVRRVTLAVHPRMLLLDTQSPTSGTEPETAGQHAAGKRLALVFFLEDEQTASPEAKWPHGEALSKKGEQGDQAQLELLEKEIQHLRQRLQVTTEQYDIMQEQLESVNEDYHLTAQELQTSKEVMESTNEELQTVNTELKYKLDEVYQTQSDLENVMAATEIVTLFLDRELRIQRYSPNATELFNLMPGDEGRPISHLTNRLRYQALSLDAMQVLETLLPIELEVQDENGRWLSARLRPYRTVRDRIEGVVLIFVDITALKLSEERFRNVSESGVVAIAFFDTAGAIVDANEAFLSMIGYTHAELEAGGVRWDELTPPEWMPRTREALETYQQTGRIEPYEKEYFRKDGERFWGLFAERRIESSGEGVSFVLDITRSKQAEIALRLAHKAASQREARQAYLVKLNDALRDIADPLELQVMASHVLGEHLGVGRAFYCEMEPDGDHMWIRRNYLNGMETQEGYFRIRDFGPFLLEEYNAGRTVVMEDASTDPRLAEAERRVYPTVNVRAFVCVPLVKGGQLVSVLVVNQPSPRLWTKEEVTLVEETAERTWATVERARAEEALRVSEEKYRTLFDSIDEGFVVAELLFDEEDKPFDLLVLETNASFDRMMQTTDAVGKRAREIFPNAEASWFEAYGRVVETGESFRFENYLAALESWFDLYISRVGDAGSRRFAIVFNDITERKRLEANLAFLNKVSEDLERLTKVDEIMSSLGARIGEHFGVMRCSFAEIDEAAGEVTIRHAWYSEGHVDSVGFRTQRLRDFISDELCQTARAGEMMIVRDTRTDPRTDDAAYAPRNTRAFLTMPFLQDGEWRATLSIADAKPRNWHDDEIELLRELTTRIWTRLERARAEEALHESQAQLAVEMQTIRDLYASSTRLLGMSDINDVLEEFLDSSMRLLGADFGNVQLYNAKREVLELVTARGFHPEFVEKFKFVGSDDNTACGRAMRSGERIIIEDVKQDALYEPYRQDAAKADYRAVQSTPLVDRQDRLLGIISTHFRAPHRPSEDDLRFLDLYVRQTVNFIVRVRAEEELREHQMQLQSLNETLEKRVQQKTAEARQLASDLITATQRERQRISHVLHDDLQQRIYAAQMQLSFLQNALQTENEAARREVSEIEKELKDILKITRHLSIDLSPPILNGEGLSHAINWLAARMHQQYGLLVELQADGDFVIPDEDLHVLLFNCVRELLFNAVKHAEASRAMVALQWTHDTLRIEVRDDGKGFPAKAPEEQPRGDGVSPSMGLPTIRHQLHLLGGDMQIESAPGAGTQVILTVPVPKAG